MLCYLLNTCTFFMHCAALFLLKRTMPASPCMWCRWVVPMLWLPVIMALIFYSIHSLDTSPTTTLALLPLGVLHWQLIEYSLHRFLFHANPKGYWGALLHFLFHGCHHKYPTDSLRLVFPPLPAAVIASAVFGTLRLFWPQVPSRSVSTLHDPVCLTTNMIPE